MPWRGEGKGDVQEGEEVGGGKKELYHLDQPLGDVNGDTLGEDNDELGRRVVELVLLRPGKHLPGGLLHAFGRGRGLAEPDGAA